MNISRINTNNNFKATLTGELKQEFKKKENYLNKYPNPVHCTGFQRASYLIDYLLPNAAINIDKNNPAQYCIHIPKEFDIFVQRENDKESFDYPSLIKNLIYIKENHRFDNTPMENTKK